MHLCGSQLNPPTPGIAGRPSIKMFFSLPQSHNTESNFLQKGMPFCDSFWNSKDDSFQDRKCASNAPSRYLDYFVYVKQNTTSGLQPVSHR